MDLLAITAPLHIVDGAAQESRAVPGVIALPAPAKAARGREHDFLFAHLALSGPAEETAAHAEHLVAKLGVEPAGWNHVFALATRAVPT